MSTKEIIEKLLIPYNSGKDTDPHTIGEHGIGWYSILDFADSVEVISGNGKTSRCVVKTDGTGDRSNWKAFIETLDEKFKGTEIKAYTKSERIKKHEIESSIIKHLGFIDSTNVDIIYNKRKINNLDTNYSKVSSTSISNQGVESNLDLMVKTTTKSYGSSSINLTQDGLFVKKEEVPFNIMAIHYDLMREIMRESREFWVDLPKNIGLTKGRNNIISKDKHLFYEAMFPAFEQYIVEFVLNDKELVRKIDSQLSRLINELFDNTYLDHKQDQLEKIISKQINSSANSNQYNQNNDSTNDNKLINSNNEDESSQNRIYEIHGIDCFEGLKQKAFSDDKTKLLEAAAKKYLDDMSEFAKNIFEKKFINANKYLTTINSANKTDTGNNNENDYKNDNNNNDENSNENTTHNITGKSKQKTKNKTEQKIKQTIEQKQTIEKVKLSINDMIKAHVNDLLFDENTHSRNKRLDGIYVTDSNQIIRSIFSKLNKNFASSESLEKLKKEHIKKNAKPIVTLKHTNMNLLKKINLFENKCYEYKAFLDVANYIEQTIYKSQKTKPTGSKNSINPVMLYRSEILFDPRIVAHTDCEGIGFNLANITTKEFITQIRTGSFDNKSFMKLVDIIVHEKAHCVLGEYDKRTAHGIYFYAKTKRAIRETLIEYCINKKVDILTKANDVLAKYDFSEAVDSIEFSRLVGKYTNNSLVVNVTNLLTKK